MAFGVQLLGDLLSKFLDKILTCQRLVKPFRSFGIKSGRSDPPAILRNAERPAGRLDGLPVMGHSADSGIEEATRESSNEPVCMLSTFRMYFVNGSAHLIEWLPIDPLINLLQMF
ncbi:hypothetical protein [Rhodohalobacter sp. 8-1]|uniref:hypothetical protein n=1 Tax=Rhodohalobacter sp. 8-1 TaxID=3131972 RepID=UPI0030EDA633